MLKAIALKVTQESAGSRLDRFLRAMMPGLPAKSIRFAIEGDEVRIGGERAAKGRIVREGEEVTVKRIAEESDWLPVPGDVMGADVLYSDFEIAVLLKPANVHTEPQRPMERGTLAGYLLHRFPEVVGISAEPGLTLLTRLDYATSGVVPAGLTEAAYSSLMREREKGRIVKTYVCLVAGRLENSMSLSYRIDQSGGGKVRVRTDREEEDRLYWTHVRPIREAGKYTLVNAVISKGKRHQIRAHLAAAGFPIVGDRKYGAVPPEGPGKDRLMLHAAEVRLRHPAGGEPVTVSATLPCEFDAI